MNEIERAAGARRIRDDDAFKDIIQSIKDAQTRVFLDSGSSIEELEKAHVMIRALNEIEGQFNAIAADASFKEREQHRVND